MGTLSHSAQSAKHTSCVNASMHQVYTCLPVVQECEANDPCASYDLSLQVEGGDRNEYFHIMYLGAGLGSHSDTFIMTYSIIISHVT